MSQTFLLLVPALTGWAGFWRAYGAFYNHNGEQLKCQGHGGSL
jgi:hypothetical protein